MDHHKKTCYHCGEDTGKPTIANQYPLCDVGLSKGWKNKPFTVIAKIGRGKRAKVGNTSQEGVQEELKDDAAEIDNNEDKEDDALDDYVVDNEVANETEEVEPDEDEDEDNEANGVESDLVSESKKRAKKSKKTKNVFVSDADAEFIRMHGRGDFSSLPCNSYSNVALLSREDNKVRNK